MTVASGAELPRCLLLRLGHFFTSACRAASTHLGRAAGGSLLARALDCLYECCGAGLCHDIFGVHVMTQSSTAAFVQPARRP